MSRRFNITLTDLQYESLTAESQQSSVPVAELIRRAIDDKLPARTVGVAGHELSLRFRRRPSTGRRPGVRF